MKTRRASTKVLAGLGGVCGLLLLALCLQILVRFAHDAGGLPSFDEVRSSFGGSESILLDRHGVIIHELRADRGRRRLGWTALGDVSPALPEAVLQAEDRRFFRHRGVDLLSMGAAVCRGAVRGPLQGVSPRAARVRGASTISMQLVSLLDPALRAKASRRTLAQKAKQALAARAVEKSWSKDEILEAYLNLVTFRGELQGIAAASRGLFGKDPHGLDRAESLTLASLVRSPNAGAGSVEERAARLALSCGWEVPEEDISAKVRCALENPPNVRSRAELAPHAARRLLRDAPGGYMVTCTLDGRLQRYALERLLHRLVPLKAQNVTDGAVLVVENASGETLVYVSWSGDPAKTRYVDGVRAKRQAGSVLKPFLYALAFERRILTPAAMLEDSPLDISVFGGIYQPRNYDSEFLGVVSARTALASSLNVPAVRTLSLVGIDPYLSALRDLGIEGLEESADFYGPSLALGSADVTLWELVGAYRALANGGAWRELSLSRLASAPRERRVFSREAAFLVSDILADRDARSYTFGLENPLATPFTAAVKTGTSKDMRDNWCVGYSARYTVGVWVGNFSGEPMWNVSGMSGAAPVWIDVMSALEKEPPPAAGLLRGGERAPGLEAVSPPGLVRKRVSFPAGVEPPRYDWFIAGTEPPDEEQTYALRAGRILYPPPGTVIALDPDIPQGMQAVFFLARGGRGLQLRLNGEPLDARDGYAAWVPVEGEYTLSVADREGNLVDSVGFEVRGLPAPRE